MPGTRPGVGFRPHIPLKCAGTRMEPPPSLPTPAADIPAAIAAASPPLEPPGVNSASQGLQVRELFLAHQALHFSGGKTADGGHGFDLNGERQFNHGAPQGCHRVDANLSLV